MAPGADRRTQLRRLLAAAIAAGAMTAAAWLAAHHPLWPGLLLAGLVGWAMLTAWRPDLWPLVVLAALPVLDFSPWTGWFGVDELDLLLLGTIAGGHARLAARPTVVAVGEAARLPWIVKAAVALFVAASGFALWRGWADAGGAALGWFQSYVDPMNSMRVFKPLLLVLLLVPLLQAELRAAPERAMRRVGAGMSLGLTVVAIAVLQERIAYPGLADFSKPYRAVGLFWEMHVGGAAIDAYLAMAVPFAVWALRSARTPRRWSLAAPVALLAAYACLTTFSRGVYGAVALPLLWLAATSRPESPSVGWRRVANRALVAALLVEIVAVTWTGSFLLARMARADRDLGDRLVHWAKATRLLHDASVRVFGIGLGRLPSHFTRFVEGYEFSGSVQPLPEVDGRSAVRVSGPATRLRLEGLYSLTQRVPLREGATHVVDFDYRVEEKTGLSLRVCELHLLYARRCQSARFTVEPGATAWQHGSVLLAGPALSVGHAFAPRTAVFELSTLGTNSRVDITGLRLHTGDGESLLRNGNFSRQTESWFASAKRYFVPWHVDNLYLELLVERGPLALVGFMVLAFWTLRRLAAAPSGGGGLQPFLVASLSGALLIGLVSSVMDAARPAFLLTFLFAFSLLLCCSRSARTRTTARTSQVPRARA